MVITRATINENVSIFDTNLWTSDFVLASQGTPWRDFSRSVELDDILDMLASRLDMLGRSIEPFEQFH